LWSVRLFPNRSHVSLVAVTTPADETAAAATTEIRREPGGRGGGGGRYKPFDEDATTALCGGSFDPHTQEVFEEVAFARLI
jgi:hypothetical protein